jgi:hypothetical protein
VNPVFDLFDGSARGLLVLAGNLAHHGSFLGHYSARRAAEVAGRPGAGVAVMSPESHPVTAADDRGNAMVVGHATQWRIRRIGLLSVEGLASA